MANIITGIRILCSVALLAVPPFSVSFYALYLTAGFSDMIDGTVARKTGKASEFGSKFDSIADFVFVAVCLIKLVPVLHIERWLCIWIALVAAIKLFNIVYGLKKHKRLVFVHSVLNKITGALTFVLPLTIRFLEFRYAAAVVCAVATIAAVHFFNLHSSRIFRPSSIPSPRTS